MKKDTFLTARWNNILSLVLGIPLLLYVILALSVSTMSDFTGFIWMLVIGVVY